MPKKLPQIPGQRDAYLRLYSEVEEEIRAIGGKNLKLKAGTSSKVALKMPVTFSLPAGPKYACPGATKDCEHCYAQVGMFVKGPDVAKVYLRNWIRLTYLEEQGVEPVVVAREILRDVVGDAYRFFRIHISGDFHSQWAVDVWTEVVRQRPEVMFWAYTRSFSLDFARLASFKNFWLFASTDSQNFAAAEKFIHRLDALKANVKHAYGPYKIGARLPAQSVPCPPTADKYLVQLGRRTEPFGHEDACRRCKACIPTAGKTQRHIVFYAHHKSQQTTEHPEDMALSGLFDATQPIGGVHRFLEAPGMLPGCQLNDGDPIHFP